MRYGMKISKISLTGGGSLFAINCEDGSVMLLPPGPLKAGIYDGRGTKVKKVAQSINQFLELLLDDLIACVNGDNLHAYLASS